MTRPLEGKSILVTGAAGGIGRASCVVLAEAGACLIVSDVSAAGTEQTLEEVRKIGGTATSFTADLASEEAIRELVHYSVRHYGRLDGAFNNAGIEHCNKPLAELSLDDWNRVILIDLTAVFLCLKYQITVMLETGGGSIVNTASSLGQVALPNASEYVSAKHGVIGVTKAAGADYGARGIRVNAILPGITNTPMIKRMSETPALADMFVRARGRHSMDRFGEPREIGEAAKWLLSDSASFVNGAAIAVDGGYLSL